MLNHSLGRRNADLQESVLDEPSSERSGHRVQGHAWRPALLFENIIRYVYLPLMNSIGLIWWDALFELSNNSCQRLVPNKLISYYEIELTNNNATVFLHQCVTGAGGSGIEVGDVLAQKDCLKMEQLSFLKSLIEKKYYEIWTSVYRMQLSTLQSLVLCDLRAA